MTMLSKWNTDNIATLEPELKLYICTIYYNSLALLCFSIAQQVFDLRKVVHFYRKMKLQAGQSNELHLGEANIFDRKLVQHIRLQEALRDILCKSDIT